MLYYTLKFSVSALIIVLISEIAKRHSGFAALIASLPLTSLLAIIWMHFDGGRINTNRRAFRSSFLVGIASLLFFCFSCVD